MKNSIRIVFLAVLLLMSVAAFASCSDDAVNKDIYSFGYDEVTDSYVITGYTGSDANVTLPTVYAGKPVKGIGPLAFYGAGMRNVIIPEGYTYIGISAFRNCIDLNTVTIPSTVVDIYLPDAFEDCKNLEEINVSENNKQYTSVDGVLFNKSMTILYKFPIMNSGIKVDSGIVPEAVLNHISIAENKYGTTEKRLINNIYIVPEGVTSIYTNAFKACHKIDYVSLPNSTTDILSGAFENLYTLISVNLNKVQRIEERAFSGCLYLRYIALPSTVERIGYRSFANCSYADQINTGNGIETITELAFTGCEKAAQIRIGNNVKTIEKGAFSECFALSYLLVQKNLEKVEENAFSRCSQLQSIRYVGNAVDFHEIIITSIGNADLIRASLNLVTEAVDTNSNK